MQHLHSHSQTSLETKQRVYASILVTKKVIQCYTECQQNTFPSDQMYSLRKISNHPNSQTSLQKLLGKSSVPCHITHIYQDAAQPLRLGVYQIICLQNGRKGTHYNQPTLSELLQSNIPGCCSNQKQIMVNITQSSVER